MSIIWKTQKLKLSHGKIIQLFCLQIKEKKYVVTKQHVVYPNALA